MRGATTLRLGVALGWALAASTSCNLNKMTANMTSSVLLEGSSALDREADLDLAREAFPASLKTVETFLVSTPQNADYLLLLARGYNSYAFGFLEGDLERATIDGTQEQVDALTRRCVMHYLRGRDYGLRLLDRPKLEKTARGGDIAKLKKELAKVEPEEAPALFWAVYGWGSAVNLAQEDAELVADLPAIEAMAERAVELDPDYLGGLPLLFQGVYYASKPKIAGGDPERAKSYFEEAMREHASANLLVPYLYGRFYGTQVQDRALFDAMMKKVFETDVSAHPSLRLTNEIARERSRFWVAHVDELILE